MPNKSRILLNNEPVITGKEGIMIELKITKPAQKFLDELETKRRAKHFNAIFQIASSQVDGIDFDCCSIEVSVHQRSVNVGPDVIHIYPSFRRVGDDGGWQVPQDYIGKFGHVTRALFR